MPTAHPTDAMTLLEAMVQTHPEATDLTFESWELGFSYDRMDQAVKALLAIDCLVVEDADAPLFARHARLTSKGLALAGAQGLVQPHAGDRRRASRDRRTSLVSSPPPGQVERRGARRDRRNMIGA